MPDPAEPSGPYKVGRLAVVNEQIRQIGQRAKVLGMRQEVEDALLAVMAKLEASGGRLVVSEAGGAGLVVSGAVSRAQNDSRHPPSADFVPDTLDFLTPWTPWTPVS
jgi:hypothetical protein